MSKLFGFWHELTDFYGYLLVLLIDYKVNGFWFWVNMVIDVSAEWNLFFSFSEKIRNFQAKFFALCSEHFFDFFFFTILVSTNHRPPSKTRFYCLANLSIYAKSKVAYIIITVRIFQNPNWFILQFATLVRGAPVVPVEGRGGGGGGGGGG